MKYLDEAVLQRCMEMVEESLEPKSFESFLLIHDQLILNRHLDIKPILSELEKKFTSCKCLRCDLLLTCRKRDAIPPCFYGKVRLKKLSPDTIKLARQKIKQLGGKKE